MQVARAREKVDAKQTAANAQAAELLAVLQNPAIESGVETMLNLEVYDNHPALKSVRPLMRIMSRNSTQEQPIHILHAAHIHTGAGSQRLRPAIPSFAFAPLEESHESSPEVPCHPADDPNVYISMIAGNRCARAWRRGRPAAGAGACCRPGTNGSEGRNTFLPAVGNAFIPTPPPSVFLPEDRG